VGGEFADGVHIEFDSRLVNEGFKSISEGEAKAGIDLGNARHHPAAENFASGQTKNRSTTALRAFPGTTELVFGLF